MATNSNMGLHREPISGSLFNHTIFYHTGTISSSTGLVSSGSSGAMISSLGMNFPDYSGMMNNAFGIITPGGSSSGLLLGTATGLKHDTELAMDWSAAEQSVLEEGLVKYADEPNIMRYIKIASRLCDKTVRDVAFRCSWMMKNYNGKRRKQEELYIGRKVKDRKEKLVESSSMANLPPPVPKPNMAAYPLLMYQIDHNNHLLSEVPAVGGVMRHLLDENIKIFRQIAANLAAYKLHENIDLFCQTRNNITAILDDMKEMPGIMRQMPPLPVSINEELSTAILPTTMRALVFGGRNTLSTGSIQLKQEPGY